MRAGLAVLALALGMPIMDAILPVSAGARAAGEKVGTVWDSSVPGERFVAVGDSVAAGPGIPPQRNDPYGCSRSQRNFPSLVAGRNGFAAFTDVTCSGAWADHLTNPQDVGYSRHVAAQLDALDPRTTLLSFGPIGANDVGVVEAVMGCLNALPEPFGSSCRDRYTAGGHDRYGDRVPALVPKIRAALKDVRERAPGARSFVVGYPLYIPAGGCFGTQALWGKDGDYIQGLLDKINAVLAAEAARAGAAYVNLQSGEAAAHTTCAPPGERWVEAVVPDDTAAPFHPSPRGMEGFAGIFTAALRAAGAGPPRLQLSSSARSAARRGRTWRVRVRIANVGSRRASDVVLRVSPERGLRVTRAVRALGDIPVGGSRVAIVRLRVGRGAASRVRVVLRASARGALPATRRVAVRIRP